jgi:hypothetical protein
VNFKIFNKWEVIWSIIKAKKFVVATETHLFTNSDTNHHVTVCEKLCNIMEDNIAQQKLKRDIYSILKQEE